VFYLHSSGAKLVKELGLFGGAAVISRRKMKFGWNITSWQNVGAEDLILSHRQAARLRAAGAVLVFHLLFRRSGGAIKQAFALLQCRP